MEDMVHRKNPSTRHTQYLTTSFYNYFSQTRHLRNPQKELLAVAVTMADLYPKNEWNFVYGQARIPDGVGVYSFARLDPLFYSSPDKPSTKALTGEDRTIILRRCIKVLLHEIGHLLGLAHCLYFICLMNGANHEKEMDRQPLYLCPVCLRKLHSTFQFDVVSLYENFGELCEQHGLTEEHVWYCHRLDCIRENNALQSASSATVTGASAVQKPSATQIRPRKWNANPSYQYSRSMDRLFCQLIFANHRLLRITSINNTFISFLTNARPFVCTFITDVTSSSIATNTVERHKERRERMAMMM